MKKLQLKNPGINKHPLYGTWIGLKTRCYNPKDRNYYKYGARGIKVCDRWLNSFLSFIEDMGRRPKSFSIDRIDNDGDYTPDNCKWSSAKEQANNRRINKNQKRNQTNLQKVKILREKGCSSREIGLEIGCSKTTVLRWLKQLER